MNFTQIPLGTTNIKIPPLGIGAWAWGDRMFWGYGRGYGDADIREAFAYGMQAGINFFDTAEVYGLGQSEKMIGRLLQADGRPAVLATKFFPFPFRLTKGSLQRALHGSLRRLQVETIDLYQIHQPFALIPDKTMMQALADAVCAGKIRAAGVSNYNVERTRQCAGFLKAAGLPLASNQISFSLLNRDPEKTGLLALCRELGVSVIAYSPLGMGMLSGRYTPESPPRDFRGNRYPKEYLSRILPLLGLMREIAQAHGGRSTVQVALNWVIGKGAIPIPGVKNKRQAEDVISTLEWRLTGEEMAQLDAASDAVGRR
ncbi:MAG: aldo/keto reductase [Anaerolineales bacterium]|nr:aldo/keto reductase [Anaerolineales bacterium]